ncbi:MAG TPA: mannose-1-phosphate guanylyltransferase [Planctomycetota bacterium]|nr:mannose-1-phosphate guanylyltransferase [Planctomycetota bacterium]
MDHFYAVIMAGGSGTRFWPLSRKHKPKQTLPILGGATMVRQTVERLFPLFSPREAFVVTAKEHADVVRRDLDLLPQENIIDEPTGRDTAAAVGLAATFLQWRDADAAFAVLPADHYIDDPARFQKALERGREAARGGALVTFGIRPRYPATSYGYLQRGEKRGDLYRVQRFCEKPKADVAKQFVDSGDYYWNGGIFVWEAKSILAAIEKFLPELSASLKEIGAALGTSRLPSTLSREYGKIQRISIDYGVMEKADSVLMIETDFEWDDVGSWSAAADRRSKDAGGNAVEGRVLAIDTKDSLVLSSDPEHLVGVLGLEGYVVVHTPDATLVCPRNRADDLKKLVDEIRAKGLDRHL